MNPAIPSHLKKYLKKARASSKKENKINYKSQKQTSKQNQIVIIGDTSGKKRQYTKRSSSGKGDGSDYPRIVYIPQSIPNMSIPMSTPQEIRQPIPPSIHEFQSQPIYRNPFRMEPLRTALNPSHFTENKPLEHIADKSIFTLPPSPPPPLEPDIVQEPNFLDIRAIPIVTLNPLSPGIDVIRPSSQSQQQEAFSPVRPVSTTPILTEVDLSRESPQVNALRVLPINVNQPPNQGMTQNMAVNQLNTETQAELQAYMDFGGYDASTDAEKMRLAKQLSGGDYYESLKKRKLPLSPETVDSEEEIAYGGGGGGKVSRNRGRPKQELTQDELQAISDYSEIRYSIPPSKRTEEQKRLFNRGQTIFYSKKRTHRQEVEEIKNLTKQRIMREKQNKGKK